MPSQRHGVSFEVSRSEAILEHYGTPVTRFLKTHGAVEGHGLVLASVLWRWPAGYRLMFRTYNAGDSPLDSGTLATVSAE